MAVFAMSKILFVLGGVCIGWMIKTYISYRRLAHIPGPFLCGFSPLPWLSWIFADNQFEKLGEVCAQYGSLVRISPTVLITNNAELWRKMHAPHSPFKRAAFYDSARLKAGLNNIVSERDEKVHTERRGQLAAGYGGKEAPDTEAKVDEQTQALIELIRREYISSPSSYKPMDLSAVMNFLTLDVISSLAFGEAFGNLEKNEDTTGIMAEMENGMKMTAAMQCLPWLFGFLEKTSILTLLNTSSKAKGYGVARSIQIAETKVAERYGTKPGSGTDTEKGAVMDRLDMMGSFIRHGLSQIQVETETVMQVLVGSDTTSAGIRMTFLHIISNVRVNQRLMKEIEEKSPRDKIISDAQARGMKYLQGCIREGLRLQPPGSTVFCKEVPEEGAMIDGFFVPGGTSIGWSSYAMQRNVDLFGPDPDVFRPERWLLKGDGGDCESSKLLASMVGVNELVFSYGRFKCLGQNIAMMELNKIFVEVLKRFDLSICNPKRPLEKDLALTTFIQTGMWVKVEAKAGLN